MRDYTLVSLGKMKLPLVFKETIRHIEMPTYEFIYMYDPTVPTKRYGVYYNDVRDTYTVYEEHFVIIEQMMVYIPCTNIPHQLFLEMLNME